MRRKKEKEMTMTLLQLRQQQNQSKKLRMKSRKRLCLQKKMKKNRSKRKRRRNKKELMRHRKKTRWPKVVKLQRQEPRLVATMKTKKKSLQSSLRKKTSIWCQKAPMCPRSIS